MTLTHCKISEEFNKDDMRALIESDLKKDLHMHTRYSDGELTPKELIDMRVAEGYKLLAITDHDGMGGSVAGAPYAESVGVEFIYGIEFDSEDELGKDLHILGYGFDPENEELMDTLIYVLEERRNRNEKFRDCLNKRGYGIKPEEIWAVNKGRYVGKPTFATVLMQKGIVKDVKEAFATIFKEDDLRAIKKVTLATEKVIEVIHTAGGLAVMAHPMEQRRPDESFEEFKPRMYALMDRMVEYGIDGIECFHPSASPEQSELFVAYAKERGLMITRGSDFHSKENRNYDIFHRP
jgi:predicted metal-dependent phosphoesterase TrpH